MTDVEFDFDGSLRLARTLYDLSKWLEAALDERSGAADDGSAAWTGPYGDDFRVMAASDDDEARRLAASLHVAALDWAQAWADAVTEQNRRNRQRRIDELSGARGFGERTLDLMMGDDSADQVGPVDFVPRPRSPDFWPTATLQTF